MGLKDSFGRTINYLRLSVTDRCNMRCLYCMPPQGISRIDHEEILSYEQFLMIARAAVAVGIEKIRVTGGEPLVRKDIIPFLSRLAELPGLRQVVLTTNGLFLEEMAEGLRQAGVQRLNISLDSLKSSVFAEITRGADVNRVLGGIDAAEKAGFPLKLNMVVMRGINDGEVLDFAAMTVDRPVMVRFIEYMPAIKAHDWEARVVPGEAILEAVRERFTLNPVMREATAGPAKTYRIPGAAGSIGVITPVTGHFCNECNRIRVTSTGRARGCLFSGQSVDLKPVLSQEDGDALREALRSLVAGKPDRHFLAEDSPHDPFSMSAIGG